MLHIFFVIVLLLVGAAVLLRAMSKTAAAKGSVGERLVQAALSRGLDPSEFRTLHNVTLPGHAGTTQVDHIVLSRFGIFTLETKHLAGWIFAQAGNAKWTQTFGRHAKQSFQNPLRQNYAHVKALEAVTGLGNEAFLPLVVMTGRARFKTPIPEGVVQLAELVRQIRAATTQRLTREQLAKAVADIEAARLTPGLATDQAHVDSLASRFGRQARPMMRPLLWWVAQPYLHSTAFAAARIGLALIIGAGVFLAVQKAALDLPSMLKQQPAASIPAAEQPPLVSPQPAPAPFTAPEPPVVVEQPPAMPAGEAAPARPPWPDPEARMSPESQQIAQGLRLQRMQQQGLLPSGSSLRRFEADLNCRFTTTTRRCECFTDAGAKVLVDGQRCRVLAIAENVEWVVEP